MGSEHYCLRWNNHQSNLLGVFSQLLQDESLVDVTLACAEGHSIRAHKVVLSACSSYFQTLFVDHPNRHPIVILKDVRFVELQTLIEFMYKGEVNVEYCQLSALLKTAESLKVKGLAEMTNLGSRESRDERGDTSQDMPDTPPPPPPPPQAPPESAPKRPAPEDRSPSPPPTPTRARHDSPFDDEERRTPDMESLALAGPSDLTLANNSASSNLPPATATAALMLATSRLPSPHASDPIGLPGPSCMLPVQQVPLSLKKEVVDWDRNIADDKSTTGESSSDYRHLHEPESLGGFGESPGERAFCCTYCGAAFPYQSKLTRHILSHSLETLKYREQIHLQQQHSLLAAMGEPLNLMERRPRDPGPYDMELDFSGVGGIKSDPGVGGVLCKFCGKSFPDVSALITHLPAHTGDRPFKCEFCGKAFKLRHHMKDHCRVHTGERPFRCALCGKTFSRSTILKAHEKTHYPKYVHKFLADQQPHNAEPEETPQSQQ